MKIAINCAFFQPKGGGIKEYIQNLVENITKIDNKNEYVLYVLHDFYGFAKSTLNTKYRIKTIPYKGDGLINSIIRSVFEQYFWLKEEKLEQWDIFHSPFFHGPALKRAKLILTVHDMRFYRYPKTYTFFRYWFLKYAVKNSIARANRIIAISQFTKEEIHSAYGTDKEKIQVILEAVNPIHFNSLILSNNEIKKVSNLYDTPFILSVGHLEPRKNYIRLIKAFHQIRTDIPYKTKLVLVGKLGHDYEEILNLIKEDKDIIYLNFVSLELLNWLYKNTKLFVFPSFYEGFGFPPLEAGIHGTISAVSHVSSMPEICRDGVEYFDPFDISDMANAIKRCLLDEHRREVLRTNMKSRLSSLSWQKNALETIQVYENCLR